MSQQTSVSGVGAVAEPLPHKRHTLTDLAMALCEHKEHVVVVKVPDEKQKQNCFLQAPPLVCAGCEKARSKRDKTVVSYESPTELLEHIVKVHMEPQFVQLHKDSEKKLVDEKSQRLLTESLELQTETTFLVRPVALEPWLGVRVPFTSPLSSFFSLTHMSLYLDEPKGKSAKMVTMEVKRPGDKSATLFISYTEIESSHAKIRKQQAKKAAERRRAQLIDRCHKVQLSDPDIVRKVRRTRGENVELALALGMTSATENELDDIVNGYLTTLETRPADRPKPQESSGRQLVSMLADRWCAVGKRSRIPADHYNSPVPQKRERLAKLAEP